MTSRAQCRHHPGGRRCENPPTIRQTAGGVRGVYLALTADKLRKCRLQDFCPYVNGGFWGRAASCPKGVKALYVGGEGFRAERPKARPRGGARHAPVYPVESK
jgi:hypothetical protein